MEATSRARILVVLLGCASAALGASVYLAGSSYVVETVPVPGFTNITLVGINNCGQVAGYGQDGAIASQVFIASPAGSIVVPLATGWTTAQAAAINNAGQITGTGGIGTNSQAFIGSASGIVPIPLPPNWASSTGNGINDSGQVVGTVQGANTSAAFIGTAGGSMVLPISGWGNVTGQAINNSGEVTGSGYGQPGQFYPLPFTWTPSGTTVVSVPSCCVWTLAYGMAINDSGEIAGTVAGVYCASCPSQGFVASAPSGMTLVPLISFVNVVPLVGSVSTQSINNSGTVVGYGGGGGWIWNPVNGVRLLNSLVPRGWNIMNAISISDSGLILALGSLNGAAIEYVELVPRRAPPRRRPF